jgi:hypothetical protein
MFRTIIVAAFMSVVFAGTSYAQEDGQKQQKLARVSTLNSIKANQEFNRNVQLMQAKRQRAAQLKTALDAEKDAKKKKDLQKQLDAAMKDLNENNQKMVKAYGFSLNRNYVLVVEKAHVYMQVSDDEAKKIEANAKEKK